MSWRCVAVAVGMAIFAVANAATAETLAAGGGTRHGDDGKPMTSCGDLHMNIDGRTPVVKSEERTLAKADVAVLDVKANDNGGVQIAGWEQDGYGVTICKAAVGEKGEAERLLGEIAVNTDKGKVTTKGPHGNHWAVWLLIRVPKAATVKLDGRNGPIAIYDADGKFTVKAENGPLTLRNFSGEADIEAENGPIDLSGGSGNVKIHAQNGPISVELRGKTWSGAGLVVEGQNGPLELVVPAGFESSFVVESSGNGPVSCKASVCGAAAKTWDDEHKRIEYGKGPAVIRLSTVNGPVAVSQGK